MSNHSSPSGRRPPMGAASPFASASKLNASPACPSARNATGRYLRRRSSCGWRSPPDGWFWFRFCSWSFGLHGCRGDGAGTTMPLPKPFSIGFRPETRMRSNRSSGSRIDHATTPSRRLAASGWAFSAPVVRVPDYSGGTATDLHRIPGCWTMPLYAKAGSSVKSRLSGQCILVTSPLALDGVSEAQSRFLSSTDLNRNSYGPAFRGLHRRLVLAACSRGGGDRPGRDRGNGALCRHPPVARHR
ncbi:exported hypothetical protein [Magnetospirillum molischianum DSM 120]|uniref:Uncharacterized protein n=1 Tax=Magnetospirillum molischianum DSM 120 TaxID=1150626 RepID=H8FQV6_MAGML|nr:exported hypothetical protein [Magnetospirillum molischianum DSM 120]